jgi:hypothetical protein
VGQVPAVFINAKKIPPAKIEREEIVQGGKK